jgi:hypothetical protein
MLRILVISLFVVNLLLIGIWDKQPEVEKKAAAKSVSTQSSNIPTIHLFSEMIEDQDLLSDNRRCFSLGPFHSTDDLDIVYASLTEVSVTLSERQTQALVEKGYWAFLPPYSSLLEANEVLLSLQALGMKDIVVIYNGEWTNAISLGYFLRQENAVRRKNSLEERGYTPKIRVQRQSEDRYWLDYEQTPGSDLVALDMQDRPNDFMQRTMPCPARKIVEEPPSQVVEDVASAVQLPDPEPVEIAEESTALVEEPQQEDEDVSSQENTDLQPENSNGVATESVDLQPAGTDDAISDETVQQPAETGEFNAQEDELAQETVEIITQEATNAVPEQLDDSSSNETDDLTPNSSIFDQILFPGSNYGSETEPENDIDPEPEPEDEIDPDNGDEIDFGIN